MSGCLPGVGLSIEDMGETPRPLVEEAPKAALMVRCPSCGRWATQAVGVAGVQVTECNSVLCGFRSFALPRGDEAIDPRVLLSFV